MKVLIVLEIKNNRKAFSKAAQLSPVPAQSSLHDFCCMLLLSWSQITNKFPGFNLFKAEFLSNEIP